MSVYGLDPSKNCLFWDANKRAAIRCGENCGCVKQQENLHEVDSYLGMFYELENKNIEISQITDKEYEVYNTMRFQKYLAEQQKKEQEERMRNLFGDSKKDRRST